MRQHFSALLFSVLTLAGCGGTKSPDDAVRMVIEQMEAAAEARDTGDLLDHVAEDYRDSRGFNRQDVRRYVHGYFIANQSIHLLTRIESIEFPSAEEARAKVQVGMLGREASADDSWDLAADLHEFDVSFVRQAGEWKVTYADWRRTGI
jgi:hypothetical protein